MIGKNTFSCYNHLDVCPETKFFSLKNRYNESLGSGPHPPTKRGHFSIFSVSVHIFFKLSSHHSIIIFFFLPSGIQHVQCFVCKVLGLLTNSYLNFRSNRSTLENSFRRCFPLHQGLLFINL